MADSSWLTKEIIYKLKSAVTMQLDMQSYSDLKGLRLLVSVYIKFVV